MEKFMAFVKEKNRVKEEVFLYNSHDANYKVEVKWIPVRMPDFTDRLALPDDFALGKGFYYMVKFYLFCEFNFNLCCIVLTFVFVISKKLGTSILSRTVPVSA